MATPRSSPPTGDHGALCGRLAIVVLILLAETAVLGAAGPDLRGRTLDEAGTPVAGARVELQAIAPRYETGSRLVAGVLTAEPIAAVRTSGDGHYLLAVPEPGMWQVEISAPGRIPVRLRLVPLTVDRELPGAVLNADGGAWVDVHDPDGEPIAGAMVWMRLHESADERRRRRPAAWQPRGRFARADEGGTAYLSRPRGQPIEVWAFAPGFVPSPAVVVEGDRGRVELERGRPLAMRFVTAGGEPAAQAIVGVGSLQWASAKTDHRGETRLFLQPGEPLPFSIFLPSGQRESGTLEATEAELDRDEVEVMTLPSPRIFAGRVVDAVTGGPLADAWVWSGSDPGRIEHTDRGGGYRLLERSAGYWQIGAAAPGYEPRVERESGGEDAAGPTIALRRAAVLAGRVTDPAGDGVAGAMIEAAKAGEARTWRPDVLRATTAADGRFRLAGVAADASYELRVEAAGFASSVRAARAEPGVEVEIVLAPGRTVIGRVVTVEGEPVAGARLVLAPGPQSRYLLPRFRPVEPRSVDSGSDGSFRFDDLAPEGLTLVATKDGFAPEQLPLHEVVSAASESAGEAIDVGDVVLEAGAELSGIVRNADGDPVAGVRVGTIALMAGSSLRVGRSPFDEPHPATTDREGRFRIEGLVPGEPLSLTFDHSEYLRRSVDRLVAGRQEPLEVVLEEAARVMGRVEDEGRRPVAGVTVEARPVGSRRGELTPAFGDPTQYDSALTDDEGRFALTRVASGTVELEASGAGHVSSGVVEVVIEAGEQRDGITLLVRRGLTLTGTVRDTFRRPVSGAILQVSEAQPRGFATGLQDVATTRSDSNGRFLLAGLDPDAGRLTLGVYHPEYLTQQHDLDLVAGPDRLDLVLEPGHRVTGFVVSPEGAPVAGAAVGLDGGGGVFFGGRETTVSGGDGGFEIDGVGPGTYRLFAIKDGFARSVGPEPVEVVDRSLDGLVLTLSRGGTIRGRLLGLEPEGLSGVQVIASNGLAQTAHGQVSDDGSYTVPQVGFAEGNVSAWIPAEGRHASESFTLDPEGGEVWIDLEFDRSIGSTLRGVVLLAGEPWRNAQVVVQGGPGSQGAGRTDGNGRFEIQGLSDGRHEVLLLSGSAVMHAEPVDVVGDTEVTIEVTTVTLGGRVVTASSGEPVARAEVAVEGVGPLMVASWGGRVETMASGEFELVVPAHRQVTLRASAPGKSEATLTLETGSGPRIDGLELALGPGEDLELDVRLASGFPPAWISVLVVDGEGRRVAARRAAGDARMPLRIGSIPPGEWTLLVAGGGGAQVTLPVRVPGPPLSVVLPPESRLAIDLTGLTDRIGTASLRLLTPSGEPWVPALFGQHLPEMPVLAPVTRIPSLPAGVWIIELTDDRGQVWRQPATTTAGETTRVTFE